MALRIEEKETREVPRTFENILQDELSRLDKQPGFSKEERNILHVTLARLRRLKGFAERAEAYLQTRQSLEDLREKIGNIQAEGEEFTINPSERTDIVDLSDTVIFALRRWEIEQRIQEKSKMIEKTSETESLLRKIETVSDLRELSVDTLLTLEDRFEGILLYAFTDIAQGDTTIDLQKFYKTPSVGTILRIDFRGNMKAEREIGAADLFPPSIRRITVYERGDRNLARTSDRRVGLKGRDIAGNGFFDKDGYIPVFSGDVIVIGGVDLEFEKKYRTHDGKLDYGAYDRDLGEKERSFVKTSRESGVRIRKEHTPEELAALERRIETSGVRQNIVRAACELIQNRVPGNHCWNWVEKVYHRAGADGKTLYRGVNYERNGEKIKISQDDPGFDRNPQNPADIKTLLQPGDWLFIYNRNRSDRRGAHSIIFLRWLDRDKLIAEAASCLRGGTPGKIHRVNFERTPLVYRRIPIQVKKYSLVG